MSKESLNNNTEETLDIKEILLEYVQYWKWIVLSVFIAVLSAYVYVKFLKHRYKVETTILIKNNNKNSASSEYALFEDLGLKPTNANFIEDEIQIIRSFPIITQVVKNNKLNTRYYSVGKIREIELYNQIPVRLNFKNTSDLSFGISIKILSENNFELFDRDNLVNTFSFDEEIELNGVVFQINVENKLLIKNYRGIYLKITNSYVSSEVGRVIGSLQVAKMGKQSNGLTLTMTTENTARAIVILNAIVDEYNKEGISDSNLMATNTAKFIEDRLEKINDELSTVENEVEYYKKTNKITDIEAQASMFLQTGNKNDSEIAELSTQIQLIEFMQDFVNRDDYELMPTKIGIQDSNIEAGVLQYNEFVLRRKKISNSASEINPIVVDLTNKIEAMKQNLKNSLINFKSALNIRLRNLQSKDFLIQSSLTKIPKKEKEYRSIERQQQIKESLYLYLLQKREENAISLVATVPNAKIINKAFSHGSPIYPKTRIIYLGSLLLGLIIPVGFIFLGTVLDSKIHSSRDVEKVLNIPILGEIVKSSEPERYLVASKDFSGTAESFRMLDANLEFMLSKKNGENRTVLITSSISGEGKSFIALNYARTLAFSGKKVLLVGMDLRAPKLLSYLGLKAKYGVSEYVKNTELELKDVIVNSKELMNLDVIGAGKTPRNPSNYIRSSRIEELFEKADELYDYIIIDSAPIGNLTDSLLLNKYARTCLYVLRADYLDKNFLHMPKKLFDENRFDNFALVVNDVDYSKNYYYKYYGYNYSSGNEKKSWLERVI